LTAGPILVISTISIIAALWPVWGWWSPLIFICLWKGYFSLSNILPKGKLGNFAFVLINIAAVLSFKVIDHEGYLH